MDIRNAYTMEINTVLREAGKASAWRRQCLMDLIDTPAFRHCGIAPWDTSVDHLVKDIPRRDELRAAPNGHQWLTLDQRCGGLASRGVS